MDDIFTCAICYWPKKFLSKWNRSIDLCKQVGKDLHKNQFNKELEPI